MVRLSAAIRRVRIAGAQDLRRVPGAGFHSLEPCDPQASNEVFERLCRTLGAHLGTRIEDRDPESSDREPEVLDRVLCDLRDAGCELWAVTVNFARPAESSLPRTAKAERPAQLIPRTRFFITPARGQ
jgi:hypothetical protein